MVQKLLASRVELDLTAGLEAAALKGYLTVVNLLIGYEDRLGFPQPETVSVPVFGSVSAFRPTQVRQPTSLAVLRGHCRTSINSINGLTTFREPMNVTQGPA